jgi:serine/threonine protein kinase
MAPESLKKNPEIDGKYLLIRKGFYGKPADVWSLGVTLFCFVFLRLPFFNQSLIKMID